MLTKAKRRILFWSALALFLILLIPLLLYSLGYGISRDFKIVRTGGIFLETSEAGATFKAGGKSKATSFLTKNALIKNLLPGFYKVSLEKDGFWNWTKDLKAYSEMVTSRNVVLIPKNITGTALGTTTPIVNLKKPSFPSIKKFWAVPGSDDFIILGEDGKFYKNKAELFDAIKAWGTTTVEILKSKKQSVFDETFSRLIYWDSSVIDSYWFEDAEKLPQWQEDPFYRIGPIRPIGTIRQVFSYPGWPDWLLVSMDNGIFVLEMDNGGGQNIFPLYKGKKPDIVSLEPDKIIILDDKNYSDIELP